MNFGVDNKACFVYNAKIICGKVVHIELLGKVKVRSDNGGLYRVPLRQIFPVWQGGSFGKRGFNSLAWGLHSVGLRNLEISARQMLDNLSGREIFLFCTELQEVLDNGIFKREPHSKMIAEKFLNWANHGFQGGAADA